jgi:hypothetical protein
MPFVRKFFSMNLAVLFLGLMSATAAGGETLEEIHKKALKEGEKTRTEKTYFITASDLKEFPRYDKIWKEIFRLR